MKLRLVSVVVAAAVLMSFVCTDSAGAQTTAKKPPTATTAPKAAPKSKLAKPYSLSTGQFVALVVPSLISNFRLTELPILAAYEPTEDKVGILVFGAHGSIDAARQVLEELQSKALEPVSSLIEFTHGLKMTPNDFYLAYYDVNSNKLVMDWKNGEYKIR